MFIFRFINEPIMTLSRTGVEIKGKLIARNARASDEWISACVDFFLSETANLPMSELIEKVHEQWLLADLRDVGTKSLPPNLSAILNIEVRGKHVLQINGVQDISQPAYNQIQKIRKHDIENVEFSNQQTKNETNFWEPKSSRCIMFALTDGDQEVKGMEIEKLPMLGLNVIPGTKIVVQGPVECRRGILMLKAKHIIVLGGEVDSLVITNAAENILARKLNLPENQAPYADDALLVTSNAENSTQTQSISTNTQVPVLPPPSLPTTRIPAQGVNRVSTSNVDNRMDSVPSIPTVGTSGFNRPTAPPVAPVVSRVQPMIQPQVVDLIDDDDDFDLAGVDLDSVLREAELKHKSSVTNQSEHRIGSCQPLSAHQDSEPGPTRPSLRREHIDSAPIRPSSARQDINVPSVQRQDSRPNLGSLKERISNSKLSYPDVSVNPPVVTSAVSELGSQNQGQSLQPPETSVIRMRDREETSSDLGFRIDSYEWNCDNFVLFKPTSFQRVLQCYEDSFRSTNGDVHVDRNRRCAWFKVQAYFTTLVTKLMIDKNTMTWTMTIKVSDGETSITAEVSHTVIEFLLKLSPQEVRRRMKSDPSTFTQVLNTTKDSCKRRLIEINSLMIFAWPLDEMRPTIMEIQELSKEKLTPS